MHSALQIQKLGCNTFFETLHRPTRRFNHSDNALLTGCIKCPRIIVINFIYRDFLKLLRIDFLKNNSYKLLRKRESEREREILEKILLEECMCGNYCINIRVMNL